MTVGGFGGVLRRTAVSTHITKHQLLSCSCTRPVTTAIRSWTTRQASSRGLPAASGLQAAAAQVFHHCHQRLSRGCSQQHRQVCCRQPMALRFDTHCHACWQDACGYKACRHALAWTSYSTFPVMVQCLHVRPRAVPQSQADRSESSSSSNSQQPSDQPPGAWDAGTAQAHDGFSAMDLVLLPFVAAAAFLAGSTRAFYVLDDEHLLIQC